VHGLLYQRPRGTAIALVVLRGGRRVPIAVVTAEP
jgi:hypothetical protein